MKVEDVIIEIIDLHRIESYSGNETKAISKALDLLDLEVPLSNRSVSYSVMDTILKDEYLN